MPLVKEKPYLDECSKEAAEYSVMRLDSADLEIMRRSLKNEHEQLDKRLSSMLNASAKNPQEKSNSSSVKFLKEEKLKTEHLIKIITR